MFATVGQRRYISVLFLICNIYTTYIRKILFVECLASFDADFLRFMPLKEIINNFKADSYI